MAPPNHQCGEEPCNVQVRLTAWQEACEERRIGPTARLSALEGRVQDLAIAMATARGAYLVLVLILGLASPVISIAVSRWWPPEIAKASAAQCEAHQPDPYLASTPSPSPMPLLAR